MTKVSIKENVPSQSLSLWWMVAAVLVALLLLSVAVVVDDELPEPLTRGDDPERFIAEIAHEFLVNLTSIGPRVAGSYENEVAAVSVITQALRTIAEEASLHNTIDVEVHTASGAFSLTFFDGMNMLYRSVRSVVVRARAMGAPPRAPPRAPPSPAERRPTALLLNCHYDTVPDSPGASDDGAGCAVVLGVVRALARSRVPLRRPVVVLLNGAEENIMQGSHAAILYHRWVSRCLVFINLEACGAGGREVVFQAGPGGALVREYAARAPRPFGGSLAQDLFSSGAVPADTDFRVFRDLGNMSGIDLAWARDGYVYHTHLDAVERVSAAVLQRTGDNVLALVRGVVESTWMDQPGDSDGAPVFFDVLGRRVVLLSAGGALLAAGGAVLGAAASVWLSAHHASRTLYMSGTLWCRCVRRAALSCVAAAIAGVLTAASLGLVIHLLGATLPFYRRPLLLLPLYAAPSLAGAGLAGGWVWGRGEGVVRLLQGAWLARAFCDALTALWTALLVVGTVAGVRSSYVAWWWSALLSLGSLSTAPFGGRWGRRPPGGCGAPLGWGAGALAAALQALYLSYSAVWTLVPLWGRAPPQAAPPAMVMGIVMAALTVTNCCWMMPLYMITRQAKNLSYGVLMACGAVALLTCWTPLGEPYSADRPQRIMLFHTTLTIHNASGPDGAAGPISQSRYWVPELDVNTRDTLHKYAATLNSEVLPTDCLPNLVYCGAPYYLPVTSLVPRGVWLAAPAPHPHTLATTTALRVNNSTSTTLTVYLTGPQHIVVIVRPRPESTLALVSSVGPPAGPPGGAQGPHSLVPLMDRANHAYFISLHDKRPENTWTLELHLKHPATSSHVGWWAQVSVAGHWMAGVTSPSPGGTEEVRAKLPDWLAVTGWPVHLHHILL